MSEQRPIGSRFSASSTAREVIEGIDLSGKTAIVTGGYSGLGVETTRAPSVTIPQRKGDPIVFEKDEHPRATAWRHW